jgi:hypothetical protein
MGPALLKLCRKSDMPQGLWIALDIENWRDDLVI